MDCSGFVTYLAENCARMLCGQHDEDDEIATTHCHVMLVSPTITSQAIEKARKKYGLVGQGNSLLKVTQKTREPYDEDILGSYITKGRIENIQSYSGYEHHDLVRFCKTWVPREKFAEAKKKECELKKDKSHWDLIERVWKRLLDVPGIWEEILQFNDSGIQKTLNYTGLDCAFNMLVEELNRCRVRTSRNELERFFVTLIRHDYGSKIVIKQAIMKSVLGR